MKYVNLPGTGLTISKVCLGTMTFGDQVLEKDAIAIVHQALDAGVNFVDTADQYVKGVSEEITGRALAGRRDKVVLATKVFNPMSPDPNDRGHSRRHILNAVEASLKRLGTDYLDLYYLHSPDMQTPFEETLQTMDMLVRQGKIRYVGVSNYAAWQVSDLLAIARLNGYQAPVITQNVYNLLTRGIESELLPQTQMHKLGVIVYNVLMAGLLTGKHQTGTAVEGSRLAKNKMYIDRYWSEENLAAAARLAAIAEGCGLAPADLAQRWVANQPGITSVLLGVSKISHLTANLQSLLGDPLPDDVLAACDEVWNDMRIGSRFAYYR